MLAAYHRISLVERVVLNALKTPPRLPYLRLWTHLPPHWAQDDSRKFLHFFLFIRCCLSVEDGPGGIYLSGQTSNPANCSHFRVDHSRRIG
jgi:hypothetical protein